MLGYGSDLINNDYRRSILTGDRDRDGGMRFSRRGQWSYYHCPAVPIQSVVREHYTWSSLLDLRTLCWIKTYPPDVSTLYLGFVHSTIPSSNDCHSSTSRCSALSRLAARQAAASVLSRSDNSNSSKRVIRRDLWRAGTAD